MSAASRNSGTPPLSARDWHVLMALFAEDLHGYAIMKAIERDSGGRVTVEIGSMYRTLGRMMTAGLLEEVAAPVDAPVETRGLPRRYYRLSEDGRAAFLLEKHRLRETLDMANELRLHPAGSK